MTITRLLTEMSWSELDYWQMKYGEEFLGDERADYRLARLESTVANYAGKCLEDGHFVSPSDCMPFQVKKKEKAPRINRKREAERVHAVFGTMIKRQENCGIKAHQRS